MKNFFIKSILFSLIFFGIGIIAILVVKASLTTATPGDKLTAAKRNELTTTVNTLQTQSTNQQTAISTLQTQMTALTGANWQTFSYSAGWSDYTDPNYVPTGYYKDALGIIHIKGLVKHSSGGAGTIILTLPAGCRPTKNLLFTTNANGSFGRVDVMPDGTIRLQAGSASARLSLDNISFKAEQ